MTPTPLDPAPLPLLDACRRRVLAVTRGEARVGYLFVDVAPAREWRRGRRGTTEVLLVDWTLVLDDEVSDGLTPLTAERALAFTDGLWWHGDDLFGLVALPEPLERAVRRQTFGR